MDFYQMLEVDPRARTEVIRSAYKALMREYHPDVNSDDAVIAKQLGEAYQVLTDVAKRARYDESCTKSNDGKIIGCYRKLDFIAEGAIGKTYKAQDIVVGELVCLKHCFRVSPQRNQLLIDETKKMWNLRHQAIPSVRQLLQLENGSFVLAMSYMEGETIEQSVKRLGRLHADSVAWFAERILNALWYLHDHGVVHGDIKPQNILGDETTHTIGLVDFGLAMVKPVAGSRSIGYTELFASPEQEDGKTILPESDFYSLGMTLIYMLTGGDLDHTRNREVPNSTPSAFQEFIRRLVVHDLTARPNHTGKLFEEFKEVRRHSFGQLHSGLKPIRAA